MKNPARNAHAVAALVMTCLGINQAVLAGGPPRIYRSSWQMAVAEPGINTSYGEGCPIETPDGLSLLIASNRPGEGAQGGNDIWAADRTSIGAPWSELRNLGSQINSGAADFCPLPVFGRSLMFVSDRTGDGACGGGDIYISRQSPAGGWSKPKMLDCAPAGPNTIGPERSPSVVETWYGTFLIYSSNGGSGDQDIYISEMRDDGSFGPGRVIPSLNSDYEELMPNVRSPGNGKLEIVFSSNRPTWGPGNWASIGGQDVYTASAEFVGGHWTIPWNLGASVNTTADETRATLSGDGARLHFGRSGDIYVSERSR
jgi:hypothetical protein